MSFTPGTPAPQGHTPATAPPDGPNTVTVVSHSNLFYWWPVWAVGFRMCILTFIGDHRMVILPAGTVIYKDKDGNPVAAAPKGREKDKGDPMVVQDAGGKLSRTDPKSGAEVTQPIESRD